jgi:light-regulated signal transduction histidine kinase (bacteriophytochrome)
LNPAANNRRIELRLAGLPACQGDRALLKQVWINLLSNAAKYTRGREPAIVEIGSERKDGSMAYFVRDNGVGFDMQYAGKLFNVFHRLHRADEFEGTGVGLAIVKQIVQRHGGRVWAESRVNEGSVFYFTLEEATK